MACPTMNTETMNIYKNKYGAGGSCVDASGKLQIPTTNTNGCNDLEYACYANYTLTKLRNDIDPKLAQLYSSTNSIEAINRSIYESTVLSGIIWAMLGTTVLYYAFTKI